MKQRPCQERVRQLIDTDPPAEVIEGMARVDALLRRVADGPRPGDNCAAIRASISAALDAEASRPELECICLHVEKCTSCRDFLADAESLAMAIRTAPAPRPRLRLVSSRSDGGGVKHETRRSVKLSVAELGLIHRALQAAKTLDVVPPQDELLEDTMQLVDQALRSAS